MIWVLTAGFGDGHNSAAKHIGQALRRQFPDETVEVTDLLLAAQPALSKVMQASYRQMVVKAPWLWRRIYDKFAKQKFDDSAAWLVPILKMLRERIAKDQPRLIVSSFPLYSALLAVLRRSKFTVPPLLTMITDSITVHPSWLAAPSDQLCVIDEQTRAVVRSAGVEASKLHVTGFPVSLQLCDVSTQPPLERSGVLYVPSTKESQVEQTLGGLRAILEQGTRVTVVPGRNASRYHHILQRFSDACEGLPLQILRWTDDMPSLLRSHQIVITKAGGAITSECLATCLPVIIDYVIPGQEEGNAQLLVNHSCGLRAQTAEQTIALVKQMLANNASQARAMSERMKALSRPCAAMNVANVAADMMSASPGPYQ